jgi:hypothetical protein
MKNAIEAQKLTKKYGNKVAVNDLELTITEGELFACSASTARARRRRSRCSPAFLCDERRRAAAWRQHSEESACREGT